MHVKIQWNKKLRFKTQEGDIGMFGFAVFFRSVFRFLCQKTSVFSVLVFGLQIFRFLASGFRFSSKLLAVFRFCYAMWFLGFLILSY